MFDCAFQYEADLSDPGEPLEPARGAVAQDAADENAGGALDLPVSKEPPTRDARAARFLAPDDVDYHMER